MNDVEDPDERVAALVAAANRLGEQSIEPQHDDGNSRKGLFVLLALLAALVVGAVAILAINNGDDNGTIASDDTPSSVPGDTAAPPSSEVAPSGDAATPTDDGSTVSTARAETPADADAEFERPNDTDQDEGTDQAEGTEAADTDDDGDPDADASTDSGGTNEATTSSDAGASADADGDGTDDTEASAAAEVPESRAIVRGGQIVLEGAVPDQASSDRIEELAVEVLGEANVINDYTIDPRASDPNLGNITVEDTINFEPDSARILSSGEPLLNQGLALLTIRPAVTITIIGHTDDIGPDNYNLELSQQRADAVKQWFVDRDIDPERLTTQGRGETEPVADNATAEGRRLNRRIVFLLENLLVDG